MKEFNFQVICKNGEVKDFKDGFTGPYHYISNSDEENNEFILSIFFDEKYTFQGIVLLEEYKDYLKDEFKSILSSDIPVDIEEYEYVYKIKDGERIDEKIQLCICKKCKDVFNWEDGDVWECESCNECICSNCIYEYDLEARNIGIAQMHDILCDGCFEENKIDLLKTQIAEISELLELDDAIERFSESEIDKMQKDKKIKESALKLLEKAIG